MGWFLQVPTAFPQVLFVAHWSMRRDTLHTRVLWWGCRGDFGFHLLGGSCCSQHMCVYICKVVYIYICRFGHVCIYMFTYMFRHMYTSICFYIYIYMYSSSIYIYIFVCSSLSFYICYISFTYHTHHYTSHISYMYISYLFTYVHIYRQYVSIIICSDRGLDCRIAWLLVKHFLFMYSGGRCYTIHPWALWVRLFGFQVVIVGFEIIDYMCQGLNSHSSLGSGAPPRGVSW